MTTELLTHAESVLTINVLTKEQLKAGYYLKEDEDFIHICKAGKQLAHFTLYCASDNIRAEVDKLMNGGK